MSLKISFQLECVFQNKRDIMIKYGQRMDAYSATYISMYTAIKPPHHFSNGGEVQSSPPDKFLLKKDTFRFVDKRISVLTGDAQANQKHEERATIGSACKIMNRYTDDFNGETQ